MKVFSDVVLGAYRGPPLVSGIGSLMVNRNSQPYAVEGLKGRNDGFDS